MLRNIRDLFTDAAPGTARAAVALLDARARPAWIVKVTSLSSFATKASDAAIISQFERQIPDALEIRAWAIAKSETEWKERRDQIENAIAHWSSRP